MELRSATAYCTNHLPESYRIHAHPISSRTSDTTCSSSSLRRKGQLPFSKSTISCSLPTYSISTRWSSAAGQNLEPGVTLLSSISARTPNCATSSHRNLEGNRKRRVSSKPGLHWASRRLKPVVEYARASNHRDLLKILNKPYSFGTFTVDSIGTVSSLGCQCRRREFRCQAGTAPIGALGSGAGGEVPRTSSSWTSTGELLSEAWKFLRDQPAELAKIRWTSFIGVIKMTLVTASIVLALMIFLASVDSAFSYLLALLLRRRG